jgi:uncharacterized protein (TIGR02246 family)
MSTREIEALETQFGRCRERWDNNDAEGLVRYWAPEADVITQSGFLRGRTQIGAELAQMLKGPAEMRAELIRMRGSSAGDVLSIRLLASDVAVVDGKIGDSTEASVDWPSEVWKKRGDEWIEERYVDDKRKARTCWFTEVWKKYDDDWQIVSSRTRMGDPSTIFSKLSLEAPRTTREGISEDMSAREEDVLRDHFALFRKAWKSGDSDALAKLWAPNADAIPSFGFLQNRAQILEGQTSVAAKMARMRGSEIVAGEPKSIRFLGPTVAVVDGTVEISGIPRAHGIVLSEMNGLYTDVWKKSGDVWAIEASRPWF